MCAGEQKIGIVLVNAGFNSFFTAKMNDFRKLVEFRHLL
jgi:hypothetical protein